MSRHAAILPVRSRASDVHLALQAQLGAMARVLAHKDSNPSGFVARDETGNPGAAGPNVAQSERREDSAGYRAAGQGGETLLLFEAARKRRADAIDRTLRRTA